MSFLGDSRTREGPGLVPAQDHRADVPVEARAARVAVRIIDVRKDPLVRHVEQSEIHGDIQGTSVWELSDQGGQTSARQCAMWRDAWPSVVEEFGDSATEDPPPADSFPQFPGAETPGGGGLGPSTPSGYSGGAFGDVANGSRGWGSPDSGGPPQIGGDYRYRTGKEAPASWIVVPPKIPPGMVF